MLYSNVCYLNSLWQPGRENESCWLSPNPKEKKKKAAEKGREREREKKRNRAETENSPGRWFSEGRRVTLCG